MFFLRQEKESSYSQVKVVMRYINPEDYEAGCQKRAAVFEAMYDLANYCKQRYPAMYGPNGTLLPVDQLKKLELK